LSSFGNISKSGPSYARLYAAENKVVVDNIAAPSDIPSILAKNDRISAIVFIDDIIASGETVIKSLLPFSNEYGHLISERNIKVVIAAICGLNQGMERLESIFRDLPFRIECRVADLFSDKDKCFNEKSVIFNSLSELEKARLLAEKYGTQLVKREDALGYDKSQLLVVFHDNCPDNTLPILWASSSSDLEWRPLFKRI
jgi:hypothetical protein